MNKDIVLIEDDDFIRDIYISEFTNAGFIIDGFGTGREGLEAIKNNRYRLVLLDIMLPDTNGLTILKQLKQDPATRYLNVILLSNLGQDAVIKEGLALGARKYLVKLSYNPDQVVAEIKKELTKIAQENESTTDTLQDLGLK